MDGDWMGAADPVIQPARAFVTAKRNGGVNQSFHSIYLFIHSYITFLSGSLTTSEVF